jgi:hypothetical protein
MRRWKVGLLAVGLLLVVGASAAASGRPVRENGRIVFVRARCSQSLCKWRIVTATARDRDERLLATFPDGVFDDHFIVNPSPDGRRLAFMASQKIWVMNSDGTGRHVVFTPPNDGTGVDDGPSFTRDGQHLVFTRCCPEGFGYSLWMISVRGTGQRHQGAGRQRRWASRHDAAGLSRRKAGRVQSLLPRSGLCRRGCESHHRSIPGTDRPDARLGAAELVARRQADRVRIPLPEWDAEHRHHQDDWHRPAVPHPSKHRREL